MYSDKFSGLGNCTCIISIHDIRFKLNCRIHGSLDIVGWGLQITMDKGINGKQIRRELYIYIT